MQILTGPGRRRRVLLAAVLAAAALPSAAQAATGEVRDAKLLYTARNGEVNNVDVRLGPTGKLVIADTASQTAGPGCLLNGGGDLECEAAGVTAMEMTLADRNDIARYRAPHPGSVNAGIGSDTFFGGLRVAPTGTVSYLGGDGLGDALRYTEADRGVVTSLGQGAGDGRPGDREDARADIEVLEGSSFGDTLTGTDDALGETFLGGAGGDTIDARGGPDRIDEHTAINGADVIDGGEGRDTIDYSRRGADLAVSLDGIANDGERRPAPVGVVENDNVKPTVEDIITGRGSDIIVGSVESNDIRSGAARDFVRGSERLAGQIDLGGDTLDPGTGADQVSGSNEDDVFFTREGENDDIFCAEGLDFATTDVLDPDRNNGTFPGSDHVAACEAVDAPVGAHHLAPRAVRARTGEPARMTLSWRHPRAWSNLRTIEVHLRHAGVEIGEITIRPASGRLSAAGAIEARGRLTREGKTVKSRLAVRLPAALAGERVTVEVEASDRRGARQLERSAANIHVVA